MNQNKGGKNRFDDKEARSKMQLLAELQIHQVELEMQNDELRSTQQQLEESRDRFASLYDYAPVGYLTLDKAGYIQEINLTASIMLNVERVSLLGKPFVAYLVQKESNAFFHYLQQIFESSDNSVIELKIKDSRHKEKYVRLESSRVKDSDTCRMVMTNINQLKETTNQKIRLLQENRQLMQNLFKIQEEERSLLARELHDELGQWLTAIYAEAETIANRSFKESTINASAQAISQCVTKTHEVIRSMLHQLRLVQLNTLGLKDALLELKEYWCSHHSNTALELKLEGELDELDEHINITVYRITQEALNNICSHAEATWAQIHLRRIADVTGAVDTLLLSVKDNGKGYQVGERSKGLGLLGMRERAIAAGGEFTLHSAPNDGTQINVKLPLDGLNKRIKADEA
ncbi:MAG: histidine kinase [Nitrosomonas sp.]|nr:histidine kinase [Nitrosomonas sp.]MDP1950206.1 histidine kinase [Nitrosomonas sp.]